MAAGDVNVRNTSYTITADGTGLQSLSVPVVTTGSRIVSIHVRSMAPELSLAGITLNQTVDGAATAVFVVKGKSGQSYPVTLACAEVDTN